LGLAGRTGLGSHKYLPAERVSANQKKKKKFVIYFNPLCLFVCLFFYQQGAYPVFFRFSQVTCAHPCIDT